MTKELKPIRIFISSPGDVAEERSLTKRVIQRLQGEFSGQVLLEPIFWEHEPLLATKSFQEQIIRPSETDIVITILWSRLGTRLPADFTKPDGSRYESGTEFEFEDAVNSFRKTGSPDLLIYKKTAEPVVSLKDRQTLLKRLSEKEALESFFDKWFHDKTEGTLVAAFHPFGTSANFEEILESHLRKLILNRLPELIVKEISTTVKPRWQEGSPFRGLNVFEYEHSPIFFGRTKAVSEIIDSLRKQAELEKSFVLVLGMSGGGKSSLVRAGVLPMLSQPGVIEGVGLWRRAIMKPSDSPGDLFDRLASSFIRENALPELSSDKTDVTELAKILRETPKAAVPLIKGGLSQAASEMAKSEKLEVQPNARFVLVIDQMEEIFSLESITHEERVKFIETIDALARGGRVWVIATLRSDFYPRCTELETLVELKEGTGQYDLMIPTTAEIGQMIRQPAQAAGLHFEENVASNESLDEILRDAAANNPSALPLLEFTLEELYKQRTNDGMLTFEAYINLGGVEGALAQRAEEVYSSLEHKVQDAMDIELHSLISIGVDEGERVTRKYVPLNSVTATDETKAFVEAFVQARLFTTDLAADGSAIVSIAHEALLQHWPRLRNWIQKNKESLRIHARVATAAKRWEEENKSGEFLLTAGKPVDEANELLENKSIELTVTESSFINASIARRKRIWWFKRAIVAVLVILTIVAGGAAYIAEQQRQRVEIEAQTSKQVSDFLVGLFEVSDPSEALGDTITAREILDRGAEKIEKELGNQPEVQSRLMNTIGNVYYNLNLFEKAVYQYNEALEIQKIIYGEEHRKYVEILNNLALTLSDKGEYVLADSLYKKSVLLLDKISDDEDDSLKATIIHNMGIMYLAQGNYDLSDSLYRSALEIQRKIFGNNQSEVALTLSDLGIVNIEKHNLDEAERYLREALSILKTNLGEIHPYMANVSNSLAGVLEEKGKYEEAEKLYRASLRMNRKIYGNYNSAVASNLNNLAELLRKTGRYEESKTLHYESLKVRKKIFGSEHPKVATALNNLGLLYAAINDNEKAKSLFQQALKMELKFFGKEHPHVANTLYSISVLYLKDKEYAKAKKILNEILSIDRKLLGPEHPYVAQDLFTLAGISIETNHFKEASKLLLESLNIRMSVLPSDHIDIYKTKHKLGYCFLKLKKYQDAENNLLDSYKYFKENSEKEDKNILETLENIVKLYNLWNKPKKVAEYKALLTDSVNVSNL